MNKKFVFLTSLVFLIAVIGFVSAVQTEYSISIQKGWNLIPFNSFRAISANGDIQISNFQYGFIYQPINKEYLLAWKNGDWTDTVKNLGNSNPTSLTSASVWMYSDQSGMMKIWSEGNGDVSVFRLESGWNFIYAIPAMNGLTLNDIKGNCNIENAYLWNTKVYSGHEQASWEKIYVSETKFSQQVVGYGFIIKVDDDCTLSSSGANTSPPAIPQIPDNTNQNSCADSDGGKNYNSYGEVTMGAGKKEQDYCIDGNKLRERWCEDNQLVFGDYTCPNGCKDGACIQ